MKQLFMYLYVLKIEYVLLVKALASFFPLFCLFFFHHLFMLYFHQCNKPVVSLFCSTIICFFLLIYNNPKRLYPRPIRSRTSFAERCKLAPSFQDLGFCRSPRLIRNKELAHLSPIPTDPSLGAGRHSAFAVLRQISAYHLAQELQARESEEICSNTVLSDDLRGDDL